MQQNITMQSLHSIMCPPSQQLNAFDICFVSSKFIVFVKKSLGTWIKAFDDVLVVRFTSKGITIFIHQLQA